MVLPMRNNRNVWAFRDLYDIPAAFHSEVGGFSLVSQTLFSRGVNSIPAARGFLDPAFYQPSPPSDLPGLIPAADRIQSAINSKEKILVWGDFDVDGQTSTTLLASAFINFGADVSHYIPNRATESHGMSIDSLSKLIESQQINLIITCDTGIDAHEAVDYANVLGIDVVITDHHQLPGELPNAYAVINPALLEISHPLSSLPGVGVAYKLVEELCSRYNMDPTMYLDLVALGIVADVAKLTDDTRHLLQLGLQILRQTPRSGLQLLFENANLNPSEITEEQIGFVIAPRLNALGRLSDANSCVDFFTSSDLSHTKNLVDQLETLNLQRQELTEKIFQEAQDLILADPDLADDFPILVLAGPAHWHPGVIGIVASRLVDRYQKPVIMLTREGDVSRGSARSIPGIRIAKLISMSSSLLIAHGGHPMAAGLSLPAENVSQLRRAISDNYSTLYGDTPPVQEITIDSDLLFQSITQELITDFMRLAPFGSGNPKLLFASRDVTLISDKTIGKKGNHRKLTLSDSSGSKKDFLWWNSEGIVLPDNPFDIAFSLELSSFRDKIQVQATLQHFRESQAAPIYVNKSNKIRLVDHRDSQEPADDLAKIIDENQNYLVWSECLDPEGVLVHRRTSLTKTNTLILWSSPPNLSALKSIIDTCSPDKVHFFAVDPGLTSQKDFLEALLGMIKHLTNTGKDFSPVLFAQRTALTQAVIEAGIDWIHNHGDYDLSNFRSTNQVKKGPGHNLNGFPDADKKLKLMLLEIRLFRNKYKNASLLSIL